MAKPKKSKKGNTVSVDMSDVESQGKVKAGPNILTVDKVEVKEGNEADYLSWQFSASTGGKVWENTSLAPQALWKLRGLLEALGLEIPEGAFDLDLDEYIGLECGAEIEHEKYQGKTKGVIVDLYPAEEVEGDEEDEEDEEEEEEKPAKKGKKGKKEKPAKKGKKESAEIEVGSDVTWEDDGEEYEGKVTKIKKGVYFVEDEEEDEWELELGDLTLA
jgi:hypothetical protein